MMNRVFAITGYAPVSNGVEVSAFLATSAGASERSPEELPSAATGEVSLSTVRLAPGSHSWVYAYSSSNQLVLVLSGRLFVQMKGSGDREHRVALGPRELAACEAGTLFQLRNEAAEPAEALIIVSPLVREPSQGPSDGDDLVLVARAWEDLAGADGVMPPTPPSATRGGHALELLVLRRLSRPPG
ncbi:MAG: hypothetical protein HOO96_28060 [Polyangiaceae bacterium]|nr:hypothetical protein [Polyangiaceae bacterium]